MDLFIIINDLWFFFFLDIYWSIKKSLRNESEKEEVKKEEQEGSKRNL